MALMGSGAGVAACVPVPDKMQRQWNICLLPTRPPDLARTSSFVDSDLPTIIFTIPDGPPKTAEGEGVEQYATLKDLIIASMKLRCPPNLVVEPDNQEFASAIPPPIRKDEKSVHVKAFQGSKEGNFKLYFSIMSCC